MKEIAVSEFKANSASVLERLRKTRKPIILTRRGKPIAELHPAATKQPFRKSWLGSMAGTVEILGDIVSPAFDESEFDALRD